MTIHSISIRDFKSITSLDLDFTDLNGFWKIEGPVGAGKTTIGEAIIYGLFGEVRGKTNNDLMPWGTSLRGNVTIKCTTNGHSMTIDRTIAGPLTVICDGSLLHFTSKKDAQQTLEEEYYDVSQMTLELLCIISFNNFKSLVNMTPYDLRQFLDQVFGFYTLTDYINQSKEMLHNAAKTVSDDMHQLSSIQAQIKKLRDVAAIKHIDGDINEVSNEHKLKTEAAKMLKEKHENEVSNLRKRLADIQSSLVLVKAQGTSLAKEIKFIEQGVCPTCGAPIDQSQLEAKRSKRQELLDEHARLTADAKSLDQAIEAARKSFNSPDGEYARLCNEANDAHTLVIKLKAQMERKQVSDSAITELEREAEAVTEQMAADDAKREGWSQLVSLLSNEMRQKILSSFIPALNMSISSYTQQLQLPYCIEFDNQFKCYIRAYGIDNLINVSSLSTGQLKTLDMCVILGVIKVIFSGVHFNVKFLDELFSNLDSELRHSICQVLKREAGPGQTVFIVSHQPIEGTDFDGTVSVRMRQGSDRSLCSEYEIIKSK